MNKRLKVLKISLIIILGGMLIPALLSIIFSGFKINLISIVNFEFFAGLLIATIGGIMVVSSYSRFKKKLLKTPLNKKIDEDENADENENENEDEDKNKEKEKIDWSYLLFVTGLIIMFAAVAVGEIF